MIYLCSIFDPFNGIQLHTPIIVFYWITGRSSTPHHCSLWKLYEVGVSRICVGGDKISHFSLLSACTTKTSSPFALIVVILTPIWSNKLIVSSRVRWYKVSSDVWNFAAADLRWPPFGLKKSDLVFNLLLSWNSLIHALLLLLFFCDLSLPHFSFNPINFSSLITCCHIKCDLWRF